MSNNFAKKVVFGQYFNYEGIKTFVGAIVYQRRYFVPHVRVKDVS